MESLAIVVNRSRGLVTVTLDGEVDAANAGSVARAVSAGVRMAEHTVIVDALGVTFVDVAGRRVLEFDSAAVASRAGVELVLVRSAAMRQLDRHLDHSLLLGATRAA